MIIRPATNTDLKALAEFAGRVFSENFGHLYHASDLEKHLTKTCSKDFFANALNDGAKIFLAVDNGICGYTKTGKLGIKVDYAKPDAKEIHRLYIDAHTQGKGVGKKLMEAALGSLNDAPEIFLGVWENNFRAQRFYQSFGFEAVGEYLYQVGDVFDREIIMRRSI